MTSPTTSPIRPKLEAARKDLLDLGLRNALISYRPLRSRGLEVVDELPDEVFRILVRNNKAMSFLPAPDKLDQPESSSTNDEAEVLLQPEEPEEPGKPAARHVDARLQTALPSAQLQTRLLHTFYDARTYIEEQGVNTLYLALGMLNWYEDDASQQLRQAPLILVPVALERSTALERFHLRYTGDDIGDNLSLAAKLDAEFRIPLPPLPAIEDLDVLSYFDAVQTAIRRLPRWSVNRTAIALGFFSYSKFLMYKDLDVTTWAEGRRPTDHPIIQALLDTGFHEPASALKETDYLDIHLQPADVHHVVDADSSQALAILDVNNGRNLVIQGPPGTGKSQTITNIIAEALGREKKVLFVSEKLAALEVVKRRLDAIGLGDACLELHSHKANKKEVLAELGRTMLLAQPAKIEEGKLAVDALRQTRDRLNAYAHAMNTSVEPAGITPQRAIGQFLQIQDRNPDFNFPRLVTETMQSWSATDFQDRLSLVQELQFRVSEVGIPKHHPFWGTRRTVLLPTEQNRLQQAVASAHTALVALRDTSTSLAHSLGRPIPLNRQDAARLAHIARATIHIPPLQGTKVLSSDWLTRWHDLSKLLKAGPLFASIHKANEVTFSQSLWYEEQPSDKWLKARSAITSLRDTSALIANSFNRSAPATRPEATVLAAVARRVLDAPDLKGISIQSDQWLSHWANLQQLLAAGTGYAELHADYADIVTPDAWNQDLSTTRQNIQTYGDKWWRIFSSAYRNARKLIATLYQQGPPQTTAEQLVHIDAIIEAQQQRAIIHQHLDLAAQLFGPSWQAEASDWPRLTVVTEWLHQLHVDLEDHNAPRQTIDLLESNTSVRIRHKDLEDLETALTEHTTAYNYLVNLCRNPPPETLADQLGLIDVVADAHTNGQLLRQLDPLGSNLFGTHWSGEYSDWPQLTRIADALHTIHDQVASSHVAEEVLDYLAANPDLRAPDLQLQALEQALPRHQSEITNALNLLDLDQQQAFGPGNDLLDQPFFGQERILSVWSERLGELHTLVSLNSLLSECRRKGLDPIVEAAQSWPEASDHLATAFHITWLEQILDRAFAERQALMWFDGDSHRLTVRKFRELDTVVLRYNQARLALLHWVNIPRYEEGRRSMAILKREIEKKMRHKPIRQLILAAGPVIQDIKPVFMMSPLSIANFLPPHSVQFDLVIFDEASQVKPVDAFGALIRGKQAVVVGDSRQLPPSNFFESMAALDTVDEDNVTSELESILGLFVSQRAPERMLRWHYRSRHESLIAVSNQQFYDNRLVIFPSPDAHRQELGLVFHYLPNTIYDRGGSRTNVQEARAVAQAVMRHAETHPELTLGVAAFSAPQMQAIMDQVELLRRHFPQNEAFFAAHPHEPFFVKNLENVQGDERDVILISIGYGRTAEGSLAMDFGPLNRDGGERRLNVLITRARRRCEVFSNFTADDVDLERTKSHGVRALKVFLSYAESGRLDIPHQSGRDFDSPFEEDVASHLTNLGYKVHSQVGSAGFFIDLAVVDPDRPGRYLIGIECDGATYHSARSARDRDRLRQQILEGLGWNIYRIWSTDWFRNPKRELRRLIEAIERAVRRLGPVDSVETQAPATPKLEMPNGNNTRTLLSETPIATTGDQSNVMGQILVATPQSTELEDLTPEALRLALEKPKSWEARLFAQVLTDEISKRKSLKDQYESGIASVSSEHLDLQAGAQWIQEKTEELQPMIDAIKVLMGQTLKEGFGSQGLPGPPGSAETIVYVARQMGLIYEQMLRWAQRVRSVHVDAPLKVIGEKTALLPSEMINSIAAYGPGLAAQLDDALSQLPGTGPRKVNSVLLLSISPSLVLELQVELARLTQSPAPADYQARRRDVQSPPRITAHAVPSVAPYQLAQLTIRPGLSLERFPNLIYKDWVHELVDMESPIHITEVRRRISAAAGAQPVHDLEEIVKTEIEKGIQNGTIQRQGDFLWRPDMRKPPLRDRSSKDLPTSLRRPELLTSEELALAIEKAVADSYGLEKWQLPRIAWQLLGFEEVTDDMRTWVESLTEIMLKSKRISENKGYLVPQTT